MLFPFKKEKIQIYSEEKKEFAYYENGKGICKERTQERAKVERREVLFI